MKKLICVVDAYSTGSVLLKELENFEFECIHIKSKFESTGKISPSCHARELSLKDGGFEKLLQQLQELKPSYVIAGSEMGVECADQLSAALGIEQTNSPETTIYRRNKYYMHERLRELGIRCVKQFKSKSTEEICRWAKIQNMWPVVVKPVNSAASDGVTICGSIEEVLSAGHRILGFENILGLVNEEILIQEYLDGDQYFVNTVSWQGEHFVSDIWKQVRRRLSGRAFLFEGMKLTSSQGEIEEKLSHILLKCLILLE